MKMLEGLRETAPSPKSFQRTSALKLCLPSATTSCTSEKPLLSDSKFYFENPTFQYEYTLRIFINYIKGALFLFKLNIAHLFPK